MYDTESTRTRKAWRMAAGIFRGEEQYLYKQGVVGEGVFTLENKKWQCHMDSMEKTT